MKVGIRLNQIISFSPIMSSISNTKSVFWPGCAVLKMEDSIIKNTYDILKNSINDIGFSTVCCGKPTFCTNNKDQKYKKENLIKNIIDNNNIQAIYTLCPNCTITLRKICGENIKVYSAWPLIANEIDKSQNIDKFLETYILHDSCTARYDEEIHASVRKILDKCNINFEEFSKNRKNAQCCGRKNMIFITNKKLSKNMTLSRIKDARDLPIITYCESCREAFGNHGIKSYHLLEVIHNKKVKRTFINRIKAKNIYKDC